MHNVALRYLVVSFMDMGGVLPPAGGVGNNTTIASG